MAADLWRPEALVLLDEREMVVDWNDAATLILGYEREEVLGRDFGPMIVSADRLDKHRRRFASLFEAGCPLLAGPYESRVMRSSGEWIDVLVRITPTATEPPHFAVSIRELDGDTGEESSLRRLRTMLASSEDAMAALTLEGIVTDWNPAAAELYGFRVEEAVGRRLATMIVPGELMHEPKEWFTEVATGRTVEIETRRLRKDRSEVWVVVRMVPVRDRDRRVTSAVMIARDVTDRHRLAEREGHKRASGTWRGRIDQALREDGFRFAAQPIFDLRTGEVDHHELLLRMKLDGRLVAPGEFIAHAEESGQIIEIDMYVARRGLELAIHSPVAINVSAVSLEGEDLLGVLLEGLEGGAVPPGGLTVEITESAAADDLDKAVDFAELLVDLGCAVALDDFGTGYGTFTYLNRLPASELKIDRSFVRSLARSEADRRIVDTIVDVAENFGMRTVAEGVEDEASLRYLVGRGVDLAQGYLLGRPAPLGPDGELPKRSGPRLRAPGDPDPRRGA